MSARRRSRGSARGLTLLEVLVAIGILTLIGALIYGAFSGMQKSSAGLGTINARYHQGRGAVSRIARELQSAFLSLHMPLVASQAIRQTAFVAQDGRYDRLDFTSFSNIRFQKDAHESDQNEVGYFSSVDPNNRDKVDLVRREAKQIDIEPTKGGVVQVLAEDIVGFQLQYLDPLTSQWLDSWDSTQAADQYNRLPAQVKIVLEMRGLGTKPIRFLSRTSIPIQAPLSFAIARPN